MKILAIRLKNLASMEGETEIDFTQEPLCSAGIFAITGPTGAGKSTILDALCLALYAKTPRYTQGKEAGVELKELKQGDVRAILRNGAGDGFAEVDFVGIDNHKYRATWAVKRARNKPEGAIQNDTLKLKNIDSGLLIQNLKTEACREIERLVGLSFDQFTRSVLLAQGDFTAFLKADNNDKASLLEKLTGTSIYSKISQQVFSNHKAAQSGIDHLKAQLDVVEILTDEEIKSEKERQQEIIVELSQLQKQLEDLQKDILWQEKRIQLNQQKQSAFAALEIGKQRKHEASERFAKLKLIEEAQKIRSAYELHESLAGQYELDKQKLEATRTALATFQDSQSKLDDSISCLSTKLAAAIENRTRSLPELNEARRLEVQLTEQEKNVLSCKKSLNESTEKSKENDERLEAANTNLKLINRDIKSLQEWKQKNIDREAIAVNIVLIRTRLEEASRLLAAACEISNILESKQVEAGRTGEILDKLSADLELTNAGLRRHTSELNDLQNQLEGFNKSSLEKTSKECGLLLQTLIPASAAWKMLFEKRDTLQSTNRDINALVEQQNQTAKRLQSIEQLLPSALQKKNASDQRLSRARLEASANVESLRNQLEDGDACPVCGSLEHPFTKHHPQVASILKLLEKEANDDFQDWTALVNEKQVLTESRKRLIADVERMEAHRSDTVAQVEQLESKWRQFKIDMPEMHEAKINGWFESRISECQFDQLESNQKMSEYISLDNLRKQKEIELADIEKKKLVIANEIRIQSGHLETYNTRIQELLSEVKHKETECSNLVKALNIYFNQASWYGSWKEAPAVFIQKLERFITEWNDKHSLLDKNERSIELVQHSIIQLTLQANEQRLHLESKNQEYDRSTTLYRELESKRRALFEGRPVSDVESELHQSVDQAAIELEKMKSSKQENAEKIAVSNSSIDELFISMNNKEKSIKELMQKINHWISKYNASNEHAVNFDQLKNLLSLSHEWIEEEQNFLKSIDRLIIEAEANLKERESEISHHLNSGNTEKELEILISERDAIRTNKRQLEETLMHIRFRLDADATNKLKAGKINADIEAASLKADNWGRLNEMIGSSDGKKFRQAAQEYTLDVLLVFANAQLAALSKRYELRRIENTLGLYVVDKDMGDEERTVVSLSGGESFLVSLALALGLASLSSSRMKVESLFIDEGFGSLDPATLNIAMDALEKLHNQGRKVGVISHVREMQERIATQIKVVKQSTGKSVVTIENGLN